MSDSNQDRPPLWNQGPRMAMRSDGTSYALSGPAGPGEGDGTGAGEREAHGGAQGAMDAAIEAVTEPAEAFRPFDPSITATGDQISVWGDDRELCILDVANATVLRDMLDDVIGSVGGKTLRQAVAEEIALAIQAQHDALAEDDVWENEGRAYLVDAVAKIHEIGARERVR